MWVSVRALVQAGQAQYVLTTALHTHTDHAAEKSSEKGML